VATEIVTKQLKNDLELISGKYSIQHLQKKKKKERKKEGKKRALLGASHRIRNVLQSGT
jgi:hypothetical protein